MVLTIFLSFLLFLTYKETKIKTIMFLGFGLTVLSLAFVFDVVARGSGSYFWAIPLFKMSGIALALAFPFLFSYIEYSRSLVPRVRFYIYFALSMLLLAFIMTSSFEIKVNDTFLERTEYMLLIGPINVCSVLQFLLVAFFVFEHILLTRDQYRRFSGSPLRKDLSIELLLFDTALAFLVMGFLVVFLGLLSTSVFVIAVNLSLFTTVFAFTFAVIRNPYLTYLAVQRVYGVLIFTREGLLIVDYVVSEELNRAKELIAGFLSAIISGIGEVMRVSDIRAVSLSNLEIVMDVGEKVVTTIFVDKAVSIHWNIARKITMDIEAMEIPPVIDNIFVDEALERIMDHLKPLFG